jgi:hypothetical protein
MPISEQNLAAIFDWAIDDETPVQYRRYTTDELPTYIVTLNNNSDTIPIRVYASSSSYINVSSVRSRRPINTSSYITLDPLDTVDVLLVLSPAGMNASEESTPFLSFPIQAMEIVGSNTDTPPPSDQPPQDQPLQDRPPQDQPPPNSPPSDQSRPENE